MKSASSILVLALAIAGVMPLPHLLAAQAEKPIEEKPASSLVLLPAIYYTPETRWAIGVGGIYTFRPKGTPQAGRPSLFQALAVYTQNKQFYLSLEPNLYLRKETYLLNSLLEVRKYPNKFWGIGSDTPDSAQENYTPAQQNFSLTLQKKISRRESLYVGLKYSLEHHRFLNFEAGGQLASGYINGSPGGILSGLGLAFSLDSRDNIFSPSRGNYFQATALVFNRFLASDYNYFNFKADLRHYFSLWRSQALALQCVFQALPGGTPFMALAPLGGDSLMRGYYNGRYRDKVLLAGQAEYRFPVWWRLGMVAFVGAGGVADRASCLSGNALKFSYGFGLRFRLNQEGENLRIDFAWGKGTSGVYFTAGEAF